MKTKEELMDTLEKQAMTIKSLDESINDDRNVLIRPMLNFTRVMHTHEFVKTLYELKTLVDNES